MKPSESTTTAFKVTKRAVIYARVSTGEQAEYGTSLDNQVEKSLKYAEAKGMEIVGIFREGFSGTTLDRPELNKVRTMLRSGQADALIIYKADRQDRSWSGVNYLLFLQELQQLGVEFHKSEQGRQIDLNDATQILLETIEGWQAGTDHRRTVTRLYKGKIEMARNGHIVAGGHAPFGYRWVKDEATRRYRFEIDQSEAEIVKEIFNWYVFGDDSGHPLGIETIAKKLTMLGVETYADRRGGLAKQMGRGEWCPSMVRNMLQNETYAGIWTFAKQENIRRKYVGQNEPTDIKVDVPAIISRELFKLANQRREARKKASNRTIYKYMMVGRLKCGCCGYAMFGASHKRSQGKVDTYYRCKTQANSSAKRLRKCNNPHFRVTEVDNAIWAWLEQFVFDEEKLRASLQAYQESQRNNPLENELKLVKAELSRKAEEFSRALEDMKAAISRRAKVVIAQDIERIETQMDELEKRRADLESQLAKQTLTDEQITSLIEFAALLRADWEVITQDLDSKKELLARLNIEVALFVEDGKKKARISGKLTAEEQCICLDTKSSKRSTKGQIPG